MTDDELKEIERHFNNTIYRVDHLRFLIDEVRRLREIMKAKNEALVFYEKRLHYLSGVECGKSDSNVSPIKTDSGELARKALALGD